MSVRLYAAHVDHAAPCGPRSPTRSIQCYVAPHQRDVGAAQELLDFGRHAEGHGRHVDENANLRAGDERARGRSQDRKTYLL